MSLLLKDMAYDKLIELINEGTITYDVTYSLNSLAQTLDMGRTPVRDAIHRLGDEGIIDILPSRGFRLHRMAQTEMQALYHFSCATEGYCARQLAICVRDHIDNPYLEKIASVHERLLALYEKDVAFSDFFALDNEFHLLINESLQDPVFNDLLRTKQGFTDRPELHITGLPYNQGEIIACHKALMDAIMAGDEDGAYHAMVAHADLMFERFSKSKKSR